MNSSKPDVHEEGRYSINEVTAMLGINRSTLRRYQDRGLIKCGRWRTNGRPFYTGKEILRLWIARY